MKTRLTITFSGPLLMLMCIVPSSAYSSSDQQAMTFTSIGTAQSWSQPDLKGIATAADSWQHSASEAIQSTEIATEKAYDQLARNVQNVSLQARVLAVLHENKGTRDCSDVSVTADNGIVTLTGQVASAQSAQRVQDVAATVYGVKAVNNHLQYPHERRAVMPPDADSTGVAHPAYSDIAPAEKAPVK
jgi:BON domain-containing protein